MRVITALMTLSAVRWSDRKLEPETAGLAIFVVACFYMCVFNPRVESNTSAMFAIPAGLAIALLWQEERGGPLRVVLMTLLVLGGMSGISRSSHEFFSPWLRPIIASLISCALIWWFWARRARRSTMLDLSHTADS